MKYYLVEPLPISWIKKKREERGILGNYLFIKSRKICSQDFQYRKNYMKTEKKARVGYLLVIAGGDTNLSETFRITRSWLKQFLMAGSNNTTMLTALPDKINIQGKHENIQQFSFVKEKFPPWSKGLWGHCWDICLFL